MNLQLIQNFEQLDNGECRHLVLTNYGIDKNHCITLPPVARKPLGPITILGAAACSISFETVAVGELLTPEGPRTKCIVESFRCTGSTTVITNLFGEAWHVSSNVPLLFE